jgi:hypothetical protein
MRWERHKMRDSASVTVIAHQQCRIFASLARQDKRGGQPFQSGGSPVAADWETRPPPGRGSASLKMQNVYTSRLEGVGLWCKLYRYCLQG